MTNKEFLKIVQADPLIFPEKILGLFLWEKQKDIIKAVWEHERVCVRACNSASKTHTLASIILSFLFSYPPCKIVTTSAQKDQVRFALWKEIERMWLGAKIPLADASKFYTMRIELAPNWFALGIRPQEYNIESMQGFHAENVLVAFDEASSLAEQFFEAANSLMTHVHCRWIIIGNPFSKATPFGEAFESEEWYPIHISAFDTPNVKAQRNIYPFLMSYDWPSKMEKQWGKESIAYKIRVLGEFPDVESEQIFPPSLAKSILSNPKVTPTGILYIGVDPSGLGENKTVITARRGLCILDVKSFKIVSDDEIASKVKEMINTFKPPAIVNIDGGWGKGVYERLKQILPAEIEVNLIFMSANAIEDKIFFNLKSEVVYRLKELILAGLYVSPQARLHGLDIVNDLVTIKMYNSEDGRKRLESKKALTRRLQRSIDYVDSLLLTLVTDTETKFKKHTKIISVDIEPAYLYNQVRFGRLGRIFSSDISNDSHNGLTAEDYATILKIDKEKIKEFKI